MKNGGWLLLSFIFVVLFHSDTTGCNPRAGPLSSSPFCVLLLFSFGSVCGHVASIVAGCVYIRITYMYVHRASWRPTHNLKRARIFRPALVQPYNVKWR